MARINTTLESAGAEHLVIGCLLLEGVQAFRAQANQPGCDILAVDSANHRSVKIQVKSRAANNARFFEIKNFDFVVFALLNLGTRKSLTAGNPEGRLEPEFYVFPKKSIKQETGRPARIRRTWVLEQKKYREKWDSIKRALGQSTRIRP